MENKDIQDHMNEVDKAKEVFAPIETVDLHGTKHPTYAGVLAEAHKVGLQSIAVKILQYPTDENHFLCICEAIVVMKEGRVFTEIGDASPNNVNSMIKPHIVRMAATRAKGRALRDAVNIGKALQEEMGGSSSNPTPQTPKNENNEELKCEQCGEPATIKTGEKNGKQWKAQFCSSEDRSHTKWLN